MEAFSTVTTLLLSTLGLNGALFPTQTSLTNNTYFDYIIIGAGTAGSVVATRLADDKNCTVLVLEAGGDPPVTAFLPGLFSTLPLSEWDYNFTSTRDDYAARSQGNYTKVTAGKALGGSSAINHFIYTKGIKLDYDKWGDALGDKSWNYESALPYFIKSEKVLDDEIISEYGDYHGTEGPMSLSRQTDDKLKEYLDAVRELDNDVVLDLNSDKPVGYAQPLFTMGNGIRQFPAYVYMKSIKDNPNLYVSKNTRATRIIFKDNIAVAVEAKYKGETYILRANKEIILCAGVFNTPQILMLSGIGHQDHLKTLGINVIANLPVGDNLIDQVAVTLVYKTKKYSIIENIFNKVTQVVTDPTKIPFSVFVGSVPLNKSDTVPNYQTYNLLLAHDTALLQSACSDVFGYRSETCKRWVDQTSSRDVLYSVLADLQPKSRGTVRIQSTDPFADLIITTGYFTNNEDLINMVNYIKDMNKICDTKFFKEIDAALVGLDLPECAELKIGTDEYWKCFVLNSAVSPYHFIGTCPMGTVVDAQLKVKGVENLRIVDASVLPEPLHGAPMAGVMTLAERASDIIKGKI